MNRKAIASLAVFIIFCIGAGQTLSSFASYFPTEIVSSGTITYDPTRIRKHVIAYVGSFTDETAAFVASNFDVVDTGFQTAPTIDKIKALNPNIIVLGYRNIMAMHPSDEDWAEVNPHEDWFLHDVNGKRLIHRDWGWYAMDVGNPGWRSHYASFLKNKLDRYPSFDGVFADDTWSYFSYYRWTVAPSDIPAEIGQRWHNDMLGMIKYVKNVIGNKLLILNTYDNGDYVDASDGRMEEEFVHPQWYTLDEYYDDYINWKGKVDSLRDISQRGKYYLAQSGTKVPANPTQADLDKVHKMMIYCLSSYLLGVSGENATFGFSNNYQMNGYVYYPEFDVSLGSPVGEYYSIGSVYARDFADGKVLVNPTTSSYSAPLGGSYKTLDGQIVSSVTLDPHSGVILLSP